MIHNHMESESTISGGNVLVALGGGTGLLGVGFVSARRLARDGIVDGRIGIGYATADPTIVGSNL